MNFCLFYNDTDGSGAVGQLLRDSFATTQSFGAGSFARGWSNIVSIGHSLFFYNKTTGAAALGNIDAGKFRTHKTFAAGAFAAGWTHIADMGDVVLFYRSSTGEGSLVQGLDQDQPTHVSTVKAFPAGAFAKSWTHIVGVGQHGLFYNSTNGAGAVTLVFDKDPAPGTFGGRSDDLKTVKVYPPGAFAIGWSIVRQLDRQRVLFYNSATGAGAVGTLNGSNFSTSRTYNSGAFKGGWTEIAGGHEIPLFYDGQSGEGALGFDPTVKMFQPGSFSKGWTRIESQTPREIIR